MKTIIFSVAAESTECGDMVDLIIRTDNLDYLRSLQDSLQGVNGLDEVVELIHAEFFDFCQILYPWIPIDMVKIQACYTVIIGSVGITFRRDK